MLKKLVATAVLAALVGAVVSILAITVQLMNAQATVAAITRWCAPRPVARRRSAMGGAR